MKCFLPLLFIFVTACDVGVAHDAGIESDAGSEPECTEIGPCEGYDVTDGQVVCNTDIGECVFVGCTNEYCARFVTDASCYFGGDAEGPEGECCRGPNCCEAEDRDCFPSLNDGL